MGKKKREHVVFDKMLVPKKNIPVGKVNKTVKQKKVKSKMINNQHESK